jgi:hypothetical protein
MLPVAVGGAHSEQQWRDEFALAGMPVQAPPVKDVEVGIQRVYGTIQRGELMVCADMTGLLDELNSYCRVLDASGEPTQEIDEKAAFHRLDCLRYVLSWLKQGGISNWDFKVAPGQRTLVSQMLAASGDGGAYGGGFQSDHKHGSGYRRIY